MADDIEDVGDDATRELTLAEGGEAAMAALVEKAKERPGVVFEGDTLRALTALVKDKFSVWINLRAKLKSEARDVPIAELDKRLKLNGGDGGDDGDGLPGRAIAFEEIELWLDPVIGAELLTETVETIGAYVVMNTHQLVACALWAAHTHAHDLRDVSPPLIIKSATKRSGKTKLVEVLERLVPRPMYVSGLRVAFLERSIEEHHPTLLIDEYDALMKQDQALAEAARAQLNRSSRKRGAHVGKNVPLPGGGYTPRMFSTWAATAVAGIGEPPDTVVDRGVPIDLKRKMTGEKVKPLRDRDGADLAVLKRKIARFVADNEARIREIEPKPELDVDNDRAKDMWEPLLAIADIADEEWPDRARAAGKALVEASEKQAAEVNADLLLLGDIRDIFDKEFPLELRTVRREGPGRPDGGPRLSTKLLLDRLHELEERPWATLGRARKPMTDHALGDQLRPYGIRSGDVRVLDDGNPIRVKGYYLRAFFDAFARYLPTSPNQSSPSSDKPQNSEDSEDFNRPTNSEFVGRSKSSERPGFPNLSDDGELCEGGDEGDGASGKPRTRI
jgi:hypothetical protein